MILWTMNLKSPKNLEDQVEKEKELKKPTMTIITAINQIQPKNKKKPKEEEKNNLMKKIQLKMIIFHKLKFFFNKQQK